MGQHRTFQYEVVPVVMTRGAGGNEAEQQSTAIRAALDQRGRHGFRVVAVTDGAEGRAIIMEREIDSADSESQSAAQVAEEITWESSRRP